MTVNVFYPGNHELPQKTCEIYFSENGKNEAFQKFVV